MKVRFNDLLPGDVIYPLGYGIYGDCCAVVEEIDQTKRLYSPIDFSPSIPLVVSVFVENFGKCFKILLSKDGCVEYNVIYRKTIEDESKDKENQQ